MRRVLLYLGILSLIFVCLLLGYYLIYLRPHIHERNMLAKGTGALKFEEYDKAFQYLKPLADQGNPTAQVLLGDMYAFGWGVKKDDAEAIKWFRRKEISDKIASSKVPETLASSEYYVGDRYKELQKDGISPVENAAEAVKWYKRSAEGGYSKAAEFLGRAYSEGLLGLPRDPKQSQYWYDKAKTMTN